MQHNLIDSGVAFDETSEGLVIQTYQEIPKEFIDALKQERFENSQSRTPNGYYRAASIPVAVVDKWMREGFNFFEASGPEIITRLKTEYLDDFITSDKAF